MDREEFFRLKKVKGIKEKAQAQEQAEHDRKKYGKTDSDKENDGDKSGPKDMLGDEEDQDVIF